MLGLERGQVLKGLEPPAPEVEVVVLPEQGGALARLLRGRCASSSAGTTRPSADGPTVSFDAWMIRGNGPNVDRVSRQASYSRTSAARASAAWRRVLKRSVAERYCRVVR